MSVYMEVYGEVYFDEKKEAKEDEENVCSYRSAEDKAYDWVLEG